MQTAPENPTAKIIHLYDAKIPHVHDRLRHNLDAKVLGIRLDLAASVRKQGAASVAFRPLPDRFELNLEGLQ